MTILQPWGRPAVKPRTLRRRMSLLPGGWIAEQDTGWTITDQSGKLRLAYAGAGVDWNYNAGTPTTDGLILVRPIAITAGVNWTLNNFTHMFAASIAHDEPTADGIGVGVGLIDASTFAGATDWCTYIHARAASGTIDARGESNKQEVTVSSAASDHNRLTLSVGPGSTLRLRSHDDADPPASQANTTRFAAWYDMDASPHFLAIFATAVGGNNGQVDITAIDAAFERLALFG